MNISDETLMAYVDGDLDATGRAAVEKALAADPGLAARLASQQALVDRLRAAFDGVLEEPLPPRLLAAARTSSVASIATRPQRADDRTRANTQPRQAWRWSWPHWGALAASLFVGMVTGYLWPRHAPAGLVDEGGRLIAHGALASALTEQLASSPPNEAPPLRVGLSFRTKTGNYCRTFMLAGADGRPPHAGLACKEGSDWLVRIVAPADMSIDSNYRMAASALPAPVLQMIDDNIAGSPLDSTGERAARDSGWRR